MKVYKVSHSCFIKNINTSLYFIAAVHKEGTVPTRGRSKAGGRCGGGGAVGGCSGFRLWSFPVLFIIFQLMRSKVRCHLGGGGENGNMGIMGGMEK